MTPDNWENKQADELAWSLPSFDSERNCWTIEYQELNKQFNLDFPLKLASYISRDDYVSNLLQIRTYMLAQPEIELKPCDYVCWCLIKLCNRNVRPEVPWAVRISNASEFCAAKSSVGYLDWVVTSNIQVQITVKSGAPPEMFMMPPLGRLFPPNCVRLYDLEFYVIPGPTAMIGCAHRGSSRWFGLITTEAFVLENVTKVYAKRTLNFSGGEPSLGPLEIRIYYLKGTEKIWNTRIYPRRGEHIKFAQEVLEVQRFILAAHSTPVLKPSQDMPILTARPQISDSPVCWRMEYVQPVQPMEMIRDNAVQVQVVQSMPVLLATQALPVLQGFAPATERTRVAPAPPNERL
jgi:hypothetical protein